MKCFAMKLIQHQLKNTYMIYSNNIACKVILLTIFLCSFNSCQSQKQIDSTNVSRIGEVRLSHYNKSMMVSDMVSDLLFDIKDLERIIDDTIIIKGINNADTLFDSPEKLLQYYMSVETQSQYNRLFANDFRSKIPHEFLMGRYFDYESMKIIKRLLIEKDSAEYRLYDVVITNDITQSRANKCLLLYKDLKSNGPYGIVVKAPSLIEPLLDFFVEINNEVFLTLFKAPFNEIEDNDIKDLIYYSRTPKGIFDIKRFYELLDTWIANDDVEKVAKILDK